MKNIDIDFFCDLKDDTIYHHFYFQLQECFSKHRLSRKLLKHIFGKLYGNITTVALMEQLRAIDPIFFNETNNSVKDNSGDYLFKLDSQYNDKYDVKKADEACSFPAPEMPIAPDINKAI